MIDDETLLAYADGALDASRAAAVEQLLARDPFLAAKLEHRRRLARRSYHRVAKEQIPERRARAADGEAKVISLAEARAARAAKSAPARTSAASGLIAASGVAALVVGLAFWTPRTGFFAERGGYLIATGDLAHALDTQLSGEGRAVRVQLTFRDRADAICRAFAGPEVHGVACRQDGGWALQGLFPGEPAQAGARLTAPNSDPRVRQIVGDLISGEAFDAAQERAAKDRRWTH
jgi:anti-sigma factor RsiW